MPSIFDYDFAFDSDGNLTYPDDERFETDPIYLSNSQFGEYVLSKILNERLNRYKNIYRKELIILATEEQWSEFVEEHYDKFFQTVEYSDKHGMVISLRSYDVIKYEIQSNGSVKLRFYGEKSYINEQIELVCKKFKTVNSYIRWVYSSDCSSVDIPLSPDRIPLSEMYPFLRDETLDQYYDRYTNSNSNILILIGPPGTGKTTWIRGYLHHIKKSAIVTYDPDILSRDYVFADFIESDHGVMVIEDADLFLRSRADGNAMIHKFLNVGDGLVSAKNKKIIFSTNLPSVRDIDPALIRPGRCFDVVEFNLLKREEAQILADKVGIELKHADKDAWSIADIFNQTEADSENKQNSMKKNKFGFI